MNDRNRFNWDHELAWEPLRTGETRPQGPAGSASDRGAPGPHDRALSPLAEKWARSLPREANAHLLCARYPRIANRLAITWPDHALAVKIFDEYFFDRRAKRSGFPPEILAELKSIRKFAIWRLNHKLHPRPTKPSPDLPPTLKSRYAYTKTV